MIEIKRDPYKQSCDLQCGSFDTFVISRRKSSFHITVCKQDLKDIITVGMELFKDELPLEGDLTAQLEAKDTVIEQLQQNITELNSKITELEGIRQENNTDIEAMSRGDLLSLAKKMNIEGKFVTLKTPDLMAKIKEAQKG